MERLGDEQAGCPRPEINDLVGTCTERNDRLNLGRLEHVEKLIPPILDRRGGRNCLGLSIHMALEPIEERVDHDVGFVQPEFA